MKVELTVQGAQVMASKDDSSCPKMGGKMYS
eukprot:CAMPEP_0185205110 /NCGR_PEP_ID=MMETSP1140-20130426/56064_1 /TAXON_ID=298111 /ORGANISM="Pavlova sp., Strain CCMP459" /LENGTH=30 /DNA_ID= /DNA_START= /DNA_END= /DNA_ORIENTATION=